MTTSAFECDEGPCRRYGEMCGVSRAVRQLKLYRYSAMYGKDPHKGVDVMSASGGNGERIVLTVKTSWLSEYRNRAGILVMFDVSGHLTSFGLLCAMLAQVPGVEFATARPPARFAGPERLRFKGKEHEISIAHFDYRIAAVDPSMAGSETQELLNELREPLARRARTIARRAGLAGYA
jgi:hypothetical protein